MKRLQPVDRIAALLQDIAYRRGIGDLWLAGQAGGREWGMADQAIHVKAWSLPDTIPASSRAWAWPMHVRPGACHLRATFYKPELAKMVDPEQIEGKAKVFVQWEDRLTFSTR
jgi:aldehyde:ferredoxin oxidoreductase